MAHIIHAAHPLRGCDVPIRQFLTQGGQPYLRIERPDGHLQLIPQSWTDLEVREPATPGAPFTPRQLMILRRWLDARQEESRKEGGPSEDPNVSSGGNDHEPTSPSSP